MSKYTSKMANEATAIPVASFAIFEVYFALWNAKLLASCPPSVQFDIQIPNSRERRFETPFTGIWNLNLDVFAVGKRPRVEFGCVCGG